MLFPRGGSERRSQTSVFAELDGMVGEARRLLPTAADMIAFRVALYLVMLSAVAARERLHAVLRRVHS